MALFDALLNEATEQLGLGSKAKVLLSGLLAFISDKQRNGLMGFVHRAKRAGLGEMINSWIKPGENAPISAQQIENIFGKTYVEQVARKAGMEPSQVSSAWASMLPKVVDALTPEGVIPTALPEGIQSYLAGFVSPAAPDIKRGPSPAEEETGGSRPSWKWVMALLFVGWLGLLYYIFQTRPKEEQQVAKQEPPPAVQEPAPAVPAKPSPPSPPPVMTKAKLALIHEGDKITVSGAVPTEQNRQAILEQLKAAFGEGTFMGEVLVDAATEAPPWLDSLRDVLPTVKTPGTEIGFEGDTINVSGSITETAKNSWLGQLKAIAGDRFKIRESFTIAETMPEPEKEAPPPSTVTTPQPVPEPTTPTPAASSPAATPGVDQGLTALAALKTGFTGQELVNALNLLTIKFEPGSAAISAESIHVLMKVAESIKAAPPGTVIEVGGHTDDQGDPQASSSLSWARASAVREALVQQGVNTNALTTKGYGDSKPVADNVTAEGRAKNRRIEFTVIGK